MKNDDNTFGEPHIDKADPDYFFPYAFSKHLPGTVVENEIVKAIILQIFTGIFAYAIIWSGFENAGVLVLCFCGVLMVHYSARVRRIAEKRKSKK